MYRVYLCLFSFSRSDPMFFWGGLYPLLSASSASQTMFLYNRIHSLHLFSHSRLLAFILTRRSSRRRFTVEVFFFNRDSFPCFPREATKCFSIRGYSRLFAVELFFSSLCVLLWPRLPHLSMISEKGLQNIDHRFGVADKRHGFSQEVPIFGIHFSEFVFKFSHSF